MAGFQVLMKCPVYSILFIVLVESKVVNINLRNEPCLENYLNTPEKTKPEKLLTEIMVPIE